VSALRNRLADQRVCTPRRVGGEGAVAKGAVGLVELESDAFIGASTVTPIAGHQPAAKWSLRSPAIKVGARDRFGRGGVGGWL
jgi:hypothetical protein